MKRKILITVSIIIILIIAFIICREFKLNSDGKLDKSDYKSREEIISLLDKGKLTHNFYTVSDEDKFLKKEIYYKDGIIACYIDSKLTNWINLTPGKEEFYVIEDAEAKLASSLENINESIFSIPMSQLGQQCFIYDTENHNYKYHGEINLNGRKTIIVEATSTDFILGMNYKYYIDKESGIIVKTTMALKRFYITQEISSMNKNIKFDVVTDENVAKPDFTEYEILPIPYSDFSVN